MKKINIEKKICNFMYNFMKDKRHLVNKEFVEDRIILKKIKSNIEYALWILTEVCNWGMDKEYLKELYQELNNNTATFRIIKINDIFIKITWQKMDYKIEEVHPKEKIVIYFN